MNEQTNKQNNEILFVVRTFSNRINSSKKKIEHTRALPDRIEQKKKRSTWFTVQSVIFMHLLPSHIVNKYRKLKMANVYTCCVIRWMFSLWTHSMWPWYFYSALILHISCNAFTLWRAKLCTVNVNDEFFFSVGNSEQIAYTKVGLMRQLNDDR